MASITTVSSFLRSPSFDLCKKTPANSLFHRDFDNKKHWIHRCFYSKLTAYNIKHASAISTSDFTVTDKPFRGFGSLSGDFSSGNGRKSADVQEAGASGISEEIAVDKLDLPLQLIESLKNRGITSLFPIQRAVLVPALQGRNLIARAKTGTGKTLAFGIPILKNLIEDGSQSHAGRSPRALVLAPTRELAKQVEKELKESAPYFSTVCIYGGVSQVTQQNSLSLGVDIVVGTPGRIIDLVQNNILVLSKIKYFVLDEADQMLDVGFEEAVETILGNLPNQRQNMLFSATMPSWVKTLSGKYLSDPLTIDLVGEEEDKVAQGIKLLAVEVPTTAKRTILSDLIIVYAKGGKAIVFTQTKVDADDVSSSLINKILAEPLHGDITQHQRERTLNGFRSGRFTVLVATDVAARGLDISDVDLVIHYDIPNVPETFVHRSGRTGRAGKEGTSVLMFVQSQRRIVKLLERDVSCKFEYIIPPSIEDVLESSSQQVISSLARVHPTSVEFFASVAKKIISEQGPNALAAAFAHLSGFSNPPSCRSLITHEQEWMTLQIELNSGFLGGLISNQSVTRHLSEVHPFAADEVRNINLINHEKIQGAVFDLPEEIAKEVLNKTFPSGITISKISKLPPLHEEAPPMDFYGSYPGRGQNTRGRFSGRRGGMRGGRNWGGGSMNTGRGGFIDDNDHYDDNEPVFSRRGGGQNPRFNQRGSGYPRPTQRTNRFSGYGTPDRQSAVRCFNCGGFGHATPTCPNFNKVQI